MSLANKRFSKYRIKKQLEWYSFLLPSLFCLIFLSYTPLAKAILYSFNKVSATTFETTYIGLKNYANLLSSRRFVEAIGNTFVLAFYSLISIPVGFLMAVAMNSITAKKVQSFFRVALYMPNIITGVSIILICLFILLENGGLLNEFLGLITGMDVKIGWLTSKGWVHAGVTIISAWSGIGYCMLICLAGLQSIPSVYYEAASMDGANARQKLLHITLPGILPTLVFLLITRMIAGLSRFDDLFIIGGPGRSLHTILRYIYTNSFEASSPNYGLASAAAVVFMMLVTLATVINLTLTKALKEE